MALSIREGIAFEAHSYVNNGTEAGRTNRRVECLQGGPRECKSTSVYKYNKGTGADDVVK